MELREVAPFEWEIEASPPMRVPGRVFASRRMVASGELENALQQVRNVAALPGIVGASYAMPDIHWGYGFPIGGVAAFDIDEGIVSPGGVGYDIGCGVPDAGGALVHGRAVVAALQPHRRRDPGGRGGGPGFQ